MKFNKKVLSFIFIAVFAMVLVACGGKTTEGPTTEGPTTTDGLTTTVFSMDAAVAALEAHYSDTLMDDNYLVNENLTLVSEIAGATVTWASSKPEYVTNAGVITRPTKTIGNQTSVLTATLTYGDESEEVVFFATVAALAEKTGAEIATEVFLIAMAFPEKDAWNSADSLILLDEVADKDGTKHTITWTSTRPDVISLDGTIVQQESGAVEVTLTASFTVNDEEFTASHVFNVAILPALDGTVTTIADALALGYDKYVKLEDMTVTAIHDGNSIFFTDGVTMLYVYSPTYTVEVGKVYDIYGLTADYYGAPQLAGSNTHPLLALPTDGEVKTAIVHEAESVEYIIENSNQPSTTNPHEYKTYSVTASVYYNDAWGNYSLFLVPTDYDFSAPLQKGATQPNGNAIMIYYPSNDEALRSFHGLEVTLDITMQGYRTDKYVFYANYFGTSDDVKFFFETDQDALNAGFNGLDLPKYVLEDTTVELPETFFNDITMTYSSTDAEIDATTGEITVADVNTYKEITLSVTATYNETSETRDFVIPLGIPAKTDIATALESESGYLFNIDGTVVAGGYYNLFFIQDSTGNIALYVSGDDLATLEANVGKVVNVVGSKDVYNGLNQLKVKQLTVTTDEPITIDATNIDTAATLGTDDLEAYQGKLVELTNMVIVDVYKDKYNNLEFTLERLNDGEIIKLKWDSRYALPTDVNTSISELEVGDKVDVVTVLSWYNGPQLAVVTTIDVTVSALTDQEIVDLDVKYFGDELKLTEDLSLIGDFGSIITVENIFGNAVNYLDFTTTAGTLEVTQPIGKLVTGTLTLKFTSNAVSETSIVEVSIAGTELPIISELFISEYGEGSSNNKWLEVYNGTGADVNLTGYSFKYYSGGATAASVTFELSGVLANGDVYVITTDQAKTEIKALADAILPYPSVVHFNGDDAVEFLNGEVVIDVIGEVGDDPGTSWTVGTGATAEFTLVRDKSVIAGNTVFTADEWNVLPLDTITNIGVHTTDDPVLTDAEVVGIDRSSLDYDQYVYADAEITLPLVGAYGSTISWVEITDDGDNATLATNVLSLNAVSSDATVVIEATFTKGEVTEKSLYTFYLVGATDTERVAADKQELIDLELDEDLYVAADRTLPLTGSQGSTIAWAITTDADLMATLNTTKDVVSFLNATEAESTVVLTATITYGTASDQATVTYSLKAYPLVDLGDFADQTIGEIVVVKGYVFGIIEFGFFIEDATGKLYVNDSNHSYNLGDEVFLTGKVAVYKGSYQLSNLLEKPAALTTDNDVTQTALDYVHGETELVSGETYTIVGTVAIEGTYNNAYIYINETDKFEIYYKSPADSVTAIKDMVGKTIAVELIYYNDNTVFIYMGAAVDIEEITVVEDFTDFYVKTDTINYDLAEGDMVKLTGVVTGNSYDGLFIQDANGVGFFLYRPAFDSSMNVGDKVTYFGTISSYNGARQLASGAGLIEVVSTGNDLIVTSVTADAIDAFAMADAGTLYSFGEFTLVEISGSTMKLGYTLADGVTTGTVNILYYTNWSDLKAIAANYTIGDTLPEVEFIVYNFKSDLIQLDVVSVNFLDAESVGYDSALLPETLTMTEDYVLPTPAFGSTFTVTAVSTTIENYVDETTTLGKLIYAAPAADVTGTVTITVTKGTTTEEVVIAVTVKAQIVVLYETGFETAEGFEPSTVYNGTKTYGNWTVVEGTVTTTGASATDQQLQMRDYSTTEQSFPYTQYLSTVAFNNVRLSTYSNISTGFELVVQFSLDGTTWSTGTTINLTTTDTVHDVVSDVVDALYVRFTVNHSVTPNKQQVNIDDIVIY